MGWIVKQENAALGEVFDIPGSELTEQKAFDKAEGEYIKWKRSNWGWGGNNPQAPQANRGDTNGPSPGGKYKVLFDTRVSGQYSITVRFDYHLGGGEQQTNEVIFRVVEV